MAIDTDYLTNIVTDDIGQEADQLYKALLGDQCFCLTDVCPPAIDFNDWVVPDALSDGDLADIQPVSVDRLTNPEKTGVFDAVSQSIKDLLLTEFDKGRITGAAYAETFVRLIESSLVNSTQFLLQKDISFWQARKIFYDAWLVKAQIELTKHNIALTQMQQLNQQVEFANSKMRMMVTKEQFVAAVAQRDLVIPKQLEAQDAQILAQEAQTNLTNLQISDVVPAQVLHQTAQTELTEAQILAQEAQTSLTTLQVTDVVPAQVLHQEEQTALVKAQTLAQKAQTNLTNLQVSEVVPSQVLYQEAQTELVEAQTLTQTSQTSLNAYQLSDILPTQNAAQLVQTAINEYQLSELMPAQKAGQIAQTESIEAQTLMTNSQRTQALPKQIAVQDAQISLYEQQVTSYQRDAELKAAKVFTDSWTALSTVNGADDIPAQYNLTNLNEILTILRQKNDLD